jgi:predicted nucleic acid-binding protein
VTTVAIVDAGPLVAYFNKHETHHDWAAEQFGRIKPPLLTCEAVMSETCFLLSGGGIDPAHALESVVRGIVRIDFSLSAESDSVHRLMVRYKDVGVSLADACLVRMSELHTRCEVMTIDRDFLIYRRDGRRIIPLIAPFG